MLLSKIVKKDDYETIRADYFLIVFLFAKVDLLVGQFNVVEGKYLLNVRFSLYEVEKLLNHSNPVFLKK